MKKILIIVLILTGTISTFAQVDNYRADLDYLFGALDKTKAATGYLAPYGMDAIDKDDFNGILADSNTVNSLDLFRFIYADLLTSKFNPAAVSLPTVEIINQSFASANPNSLTLFYANYNEFNENAINQGYIRYSNGRLYDAEPAANKNYKLVFGPYITKKLFAASAITQYFKNTVTLRFNPDLLYNNTTATIQNIWVDFGNGYVLMPANTDMSHTYTDSTGYHRIAVKAALSNGDLVETYIATMVEVTEPGSNIYSNANLDFPDFTIPADASQSGCKVYIRRSVFTPGTQILKPLIVAEGLDLHDGAPAIDKTNYNVNDLIREWNGINLPNGQNLNFNFDDIAHYDLIFIDWTDGVDDIRRNAITMEMVINTINVMNTGSEENVVMGISMGGLVARYCLASMTKRNVATRTRLLITHDSPHRGAYVPLAFQHLVTGLQNRTILGIRLGAIHGFLDQGVTLLNKPGPQQQLIMTVADANGTVNQNSFLETIYRPMVTFTSSDPTPSYQFLATSMGSQCGIASNPVGYTMVSGEGQGSLGGIYYIFSAGIVSKMRFKVSIDAKGLKADNLGSEILYFRWRRESSMFWGAVNTSKTFIDLHRNEPTNIANPIPWESVPGGVENLRFANQSVYSGNWSVFSLGFLGYDYRFTIGNSFTFVPVISALDVSNPNAFNKNNIFNFVANNNSPAGTFIPQKIISQEEFFGPSGSAFNQPHTDFTSRNSRWIFNEMQNISQPLTCEDECEPVSGAYEITGPDEVCSSGIYTVTNVPTNGTVTWPASGYYTVTILNSNGSQVSITITGSGVAYLNATINIGGGCFVGNTATTSKQIKMGPPTSSSYIPYFTTNGNTTYLEDINYLLTYNPPGLYSGTIAIVDPLINQITWTKIGGNAATYSFGASPDGKDVNIMVKGQCKYVIYRMLASNNCGTYSHDYRFVADNVVCFTNGASDSLPQFTINPNPSSGQIALTLKSNQQLTSIKEVIITNKMGIPVFQQRFLNYQKGQTINLSNLPTDIYTIKVFDGEKWDTQKLVLQK